MIEKRSHIWQWFLDNKIEPTNLKAAMLVAYPHPNTENWQQLIANILLYLGVLLLSAGMIFFMAFNWDALAHLSKFAIVEGLFALFISGFYLINRMQKSSIHRKTLLNNRAKMFMAGACPMPCYSVPASCLGHYWPWWDKHTKPVQILGNYLLFGQC
tara:strand:+ start:68 stop:538 length:471 start_codon:yes stop_codon:yes gene_type:complete